jgi:hypothetical protein
MRFEIPAGNLERFLSKFADLQKRARKLSIPEPDSPIVGELYYQEHANERGKKIKTPYHSVELPDDLGKIGMDGWSFLATLHHEAEGETLVATVPGVELNPAWRWASNNCDHCGYKRRRNATYLVLKDGETLQVGRSCLRDFLPSHGRDPLSLARWAEHVGAFWSWYLSSDEPTSGTERDPWEDLPWFLTVASLVQRKAGWVSKGKAQYDPEAVPTATLISSYLYQPSTRDNPSLRSEWGDPTDADVDRANKVLDWAEENLVPDGEELSDYEHNLGVVARLGIVRQRHWGLAASMISAWQRANNLGIEGQEPKVKRDPSEHIAEEGQRILLHNLEILWVKEMEDRGWGSSLLLKMVHRNRDIVTIFWSGDRWDELEPGVRIHLKGTVKRHSEFKDSKETQLNRVKIALADDEPEVYANVKKGRTDFHDLGEDQIPLGFHEEG